MGSILGLAVALAGLMVAGQVILWMIVVSRLVKMPMRSPMVLPIQRSLVEDVLPVLDTVRPQLEQNGFQYMHSRRARSLIAVVGVPTNYCDVYYHSGQDIHAEVYLATPPTPHQLCDIYLVNTYVDGSALLTVNNLLHALTPYPSNVRIVDGRDADLAGQVATHLKAREAITVARTDPSDALAIAKTMAEQLLPRMEQERLVYRRGHRGAEVIYGFRFLAAVRYALRVRWATMQSKKKAKLPKGTPAPVPDFGTARLVAERIAFARTLCTLRGLRAPRWFKRTVFAFSALAFLTLGSWWWGPLGAAIIAAVILLHEAGHWMAMKLAGFRDVQVFFVPGMGGATSGEKHEAHPMTHLMVYLAGPVPGLMLALAVFAWVAFTPDHSGAVWYPLLMTGTVATLLINALNMLPVLPLDGGRVVDLLLVGRLPWLRFIFAVVSGGLFFAAGTSNGDNVLRVIGIAMLIGSQQHYRIAKASAMLLREKLQTPAAVSDFSTVAKQLHDFLGKPAFQKWPYRTKLAVGQALLPRYLGRIPSWKETALGMAVYVFCALVPLVGLAGLTIISPMAVMGALGQHVGSGGRTTDPASTMAPAASASQAAPVDIALRQKASRAQRDARLASVQGPAERQAAYEEAIHDADEDGDGDDTLRLARQNYTETNALAAPARERAQAALLLVTTLSGNENNPERAETKSLLAEAESILRQRMATASDKQDILLLAQTLEERISPSDKAARLAMRQEIVALLSSSVDPSDNALASARRNLARALDRVGQADAAERALRTAVADTTSSPATLPFKQSLLDDLAWMLVTHRKLDEAARIANAQISDPGNDELVGRLYRRDAHLVLLMAARLQGDWMGANQQAIALLGMKTANGAQGGNWFTHLLLSRWSSPQLDRRITLLQVESERALGHTTVADKLVADMRKSVPEFAKTLPSASNCRMRVTDTLWRREFQQALLDIEQRELQCVAALGTVSSAAAYD